MEIFMEIFMEIDGKCVGENDENHEVSVRYNLFFMEINLWKC